MKLKIIYKGVLFVSLLLAFLVAIPGSAAAQYRHNRGVDRPYAYMGLTVGGGLGAIPVTLENGSQSPGMNFDLGVHYTHFFSRIGLGFGLHVSRVGANATYGFEEVTEGLTHADNPRASYNLITRYADWREHQSIRVLELPLELFFRAPMGGGKLFICGAGVQFLMPLGGKYSAGGGSYTTTGVFPALGTYEVGDMPEHGFATYNEIDETAIGGLKTGVGVVADLGVRLPLGDDGGLYIGLYGSYGLSNMVGDREGSPLLTLNARDASRIDYHGTFAADPSAALHLLTVGVKVGLDLGAPMDM